MRKGRVLFESSLVVILGVAVLGSTLALSKRGDFSFLDPIIDVKHLITEQYVEQVDETKLQQGAINGMIEALNDPYTVYVPPAGKNEFVKDLMGEYVGIGAQVNQLDGWLIIVSPLEDSPAYRVGLMADDRVLEVEGKSTHNLPIDKCIEMLLGDPGTKVHILVERKGEKIPFEITRDHIKTRSVKGYHREDADGNKWMYLIDPARKIGYLRLTQFTPRCAEELLSALTIMGADKGELKGLILDLRFNPGGLLNEAEAIADLFLEDGVIVSTRGRAHPEEIVKARKEGTLPNFPLAVLVNGQSASASEVLSGALVENNRAIVVGTRSFGKGSVQGVVELPRGKGAQVKITEQGYYLPSGRSITRKDDSAVWGVDPTEGFYIPMADAEIVTMLEARRQQDVLHAGSLANDPSQKWADTDWVLATLKDPQLSAAVKAVQVKADTGEWKGTGEKGLDTSKVVVGELQKLRDYRKRLERELIKADKRLEAVESAAGDSAVDAKDLLPDGVDLAGGEMTITDKSGKVIAKLDITGNNVERWLLDADVKKKEAAKAGEKTGDKASDKAGDKK